MPSVSSWFAIAATIGHEVGAVHALAQRLVHEDRAGLPVRVARERVPHVVQVAGDATRGSPRAR